MWIKTDRSNTGSLGDQQDRVVACLLNRERIHLKALWEALQLSRKS